ncbi:MAG TPA: HAMP domain-containing sensor histidine kinase [Candidatus Acidoferrales bacterium]|nr:HAMP domain-containing sensor histidine kinase [Candidatus Acidoferrales bacterium]
MSGTRRLSSLRQLGTLIGRALDEQGGVPLLILRLPEVAQRLERQTVEAFARAAQSVVREGDRLAHEPGSDWFAIAMLAPARHGVRMPSLDVRAALERIAATMSLVIGKRLETGWWTVASRREMDEFDVTIERALGRGARERERYEFLATVGHELRTPLTSIRGYIETLLDDDLDPPTARRFLEVARSEALRLGRLVDGMLDFSPLDLSPQPVPGVTDLAQAAHAAVEALAPLARQASMHVEIRCEAALRARIGSDACMHVLLNVIENAIKYASPAGRVRVSVERQDPFVHLVVDDDGPGIPTSQRERIFEHRARGDAARRTRGSGIGLAIVRTIVARAAGTVCVEDSPLGGARFTIRLPHAKADFPSSLS